MLNCHAWQLTLNEVVICTGDRAFGHHPCEAKRHCNWGGLCAVEAATSGGACAEQAQNKLGHTICRGGPGQETGEHFAYMIQRTQAGKQSLQYQLTVRICGLKSGHLLSVLPVSVCIQCAAC